MFIVKVSFEAT